MKNQHISRVIDLRRYRHKAKGLLVVSIAASAVALLALLTTLDR